MQPSLCSRVVRHFRHQLGDTKLLVHILVAVFAFSSWVAVNGLWVELPLLVLEAPEGWSLPSFMTIISQVANIGPIMFVVIAVLLPNSKPKLEKVTSVIIIVIGIASAVLLSFFWDKTSFVAGKTRSTALMSLNLFLAVGDCTSSISFYAFMSLLKPQYMTSLFIGEGFSGMIPALIALGQGVGEITCVNTSVTTNETFPNGTEYNSTTYQVVPRFDQPRFSVEIFFFTLAIILLLSLVAFILLNTLPYCQTEMVDPSGNGYENIPSSDNDLPDFGSTLGIADPWLEDELDVQNLQQPQQQMSKLRFFTFLVVLVVINLIITSFLGTIQIYSTLPYGLRPYHLATTLTAITNPVACLFALISLTESLASVLVITSLGMIGSAYIVYLAVMSPSPPLVDEDIGAVLSVGAWLVVTFLLIYGKVCIGGVMRKLGRQALIWAGVATQVGSLIGALLGFFLVLESNIFHDSPYC